MLLSTRLFSSLRSIPRRISINSTNTTVLNSPTDYLNAILNNIASSQDRIVFSALYCGTGEPERLIIAKIDAAMSDRNKPNLQCTFILDFSRTERSTSNLYEELMKKYRNRVNVLLYRMPPKFGLFTSYIPGQLAEVLGVYHCKFCMFDQNILLTGANLSTEYLSNRQDRYILLEHSSLNDSEMENSAKLHCDLPRFLQSFVDIIDPYCYHVGYDDTKSVEVDKLTIRKPILSSHDGLGFKLKALQLQEEEPLETEISDTSTILRPLVQHFTCGVSDESDNLLSILFPAHTKPFKTSPFKENIGPITPTLSILSPIDASNKSYKSSEKDLKLNTTKWDRVVIASPYPSFLPMFTSRLLSILTSDNHDNKHEPVYHRNIQNDGTNCEDGNNKESRIRAFDFALGREKSKERKNDEVADESSTYSNIISDKRINVEQILIPDSAIISKKEISLKIIIPEGRAHGFHNGGGLKYLIPQMHSYALKSVLLLSQLRNDIEQHQYQDIETTPAGVGGRPDIPSRYSGMFINPYYRKDWTFHSKGIWLFSSSTASKGHQLNASNASPPIIINNSTATDEQASKTAATYIGSSNFGERSCYRDFELGFVLHTTCPSLISQLSKECSRLEEHSKEYSMSLNEFTSSAVTTKWYIKHLTRLLRTFL
jgi:phosphatidylserine/phosphatidylglycerophosphate/cardiolipin synthase-like enzyme